MAVAEGTAARYGWEVGDTVALTFADGRTGAVQVVSVVADGSVPAPVMLSAAAVRAHDPSALTETVYVRGVDAAAVNRAVAGLGATAVAVATYTATDDEDRLVWIFALIMVGMSVGYTGIAVANTLMMATAARTRDFAVLRMSGATVVQVLRVVAAETVLVVGLGTALGAAVALPALSGIRSALAESVGRPVALLLPWPELIAVAGACLALALVASLTAAGLALRSRKTQIE
jgi:putative ABC transport system permease protein